MATITFPLTELAPMFGDVRRQTKCAAVNSKAIREEAGNILGVLRDIIKLRRQLFDVVSRQGQLLVKLNQVNFDVVPFGSTEEIANLIDQILDDESDVLSQTAKLESDVRAWWNAPLYRWWQIPLLKLSEQMDYLGSIVESLRLECNDEAATLLGIAVEHSQAK